MPKKPKEFVPKKPAMRLARPLHARPRDGVAPMVKTLRDKTRLPDGEVASEVRPVTHREIEREPKRRRNVSKEEGRQILLRLLEDKKKNPKKYPKI